MNGLLAKRIWECGAEVARREQAKMLDGGRTSAFGGCVDTLRGLRFALVQAVTRDIEGSLAKITSEFLAMENLHKKTVLDREEAAAK